MKDKSNEIYKAVIDELEAVGATYRLETSSKHHMLLWEKGAIKGKMPLSMSPSDWRAPMNAKRDIRRSLRERGVISSPVLSAFDPTPTKKDVTPRETPAVEASETTVVLAEPIVLDAQRLVVIDDQPRMRDVDVGSALGYSRPLNVRQLIEANLAELKTYGEIKVETLGASSQGGRPSNAYLLNKEQSLLVAMFSRTPRAAEVRHQVITAYSTWEAAHAPDPIKVVATQPEILANDLAIEAIIGRLVPAVIEGLPKDAIRPSLPSSLPTDGPKGDFVSRKQFEEVMSQMVSFMRNRFDRNDRLMNEVYNARIDTGEGISKRIEASHKSFIEEVRQTLTQTKDALSEITTTIARQDRILAQVKTAEPAAAVTPAKAAPKPAEHAVPQQPMNLVSIPEIYTMIGLDPREIVERRSLGQAIRGSLAVFCRENRLKVYRRKGLNQDRLEWSRETIAIWYREVGRDLILEHIDRYS